jgi:hypothetical protein
MNDATSSRLAARLFGRIRILVGAESMPGPKTCQRINKSIFFIRGTAFRAEKRYFYVMAARDGAAQTNNEAKHRDTRKHLARLGIGGN